MRWQLRLSALLLACSISFAPLFAQSAAPHPVAEWVRSGIIYEINPRTFSPSANFRGIEQRLDDLQQLGVTILWIMPIHPPGQLNKKGTYGSAYAVRDYYAIDPAYGTKDDLKRLVSAAHRRGMRVIIDIVADHTSWDNALIKHPEYYKHDAKGNIVPPEPDWADVAALNYENPQLRAYMTEMLKYWLRDFDLDGFRCDVAFMVPTDFWENARVELARIKPEIVMLAEANTPALMMKAFDLDYDWPFEHALTDMIENGAPATLLAETWSRERQKFPRGVIEMRFSDDHDELRAIVRLGELGALAASVLVFTLDGVPLLYNGMEVGDTTESGAPALFEKMPVFWQIAERRPDFLPFYRQLIALRRAHPALQQGETEWLPNSAPSRIITFARRAGSEEFLVAVNVTNQPFAGTVSAPAGTYVDVTPGQRATSNQAVTLPALSLGAWEFRIFSKQVK
jgi:glycosidase